MDLRTVRRTRTINRVANESMDMPTENGAEAGPPLDDVMDDIRRELIRRIAASDREANRAVYDALENE